MVEALWEDAVVVACEDIELLSLRPRVAKSTWYVEVFENASADRECCPLIKMKCKDEETAGKLREALLEAEVDWQTFTSLSEL